MGMGLNMTAYDLAIIAVFVFFMARGIWVGLLGQVTVIVALYVGYLVSGQYHDKLFPFLRGVSTNPQVVFLLAYAILFACTYVLTMLIGKALIIAILLHMLLTTFLPPDTPMLRQCQLCPYLSQALTWSQQMIKDDKVRQAFQKKMPAIPDQVKAHPAVPLMKPGTPAVPPVASPPVKKNLEEQTPVKPLPAVQ